MIFEKKHYITPGILKSLFFQSFFLIAGPWNKSKKDWVASRETINDLNQNKIPVLTDPKELPPQCHDCIKCIEVCPTQCLSLLTNQSGHIQSFKINLLNCISCSKCVDSCPTKKLVMCNIGLGPGPVESDWMLELMGFSAEFQADRSV
ncbi:MAG: 4Fe-4S dicluster domain-containing protein [Bdellovibrio sp.]|nr:4Fe-4S dicluster domain-containing protein [Bdellovibrio sp.]